MKSSIQHHEFSRELLESRYVLVSVATKEVSRLPEVAWKQSACRMWGVVSSVHIAIQATEATEIFLEHDAKELSPSIFICF